MKLIHGSRATARSLCIAAMVSSLLSFSAHATPVLFAEAHYNAPGAVTQGGGAGVTAVIGSPQTDTTSVNILSFFAADTFGMDMIDDVDIGVHTYGNVGTATTFGNRVSGEIRAGGPGSYDVDGTFKVTLDDVGDSFSFNILPGVISANGSAGFVTGDFVSAELEFEILVDSKEAFYSKATVGVASIAGNGAVFDPNGTVLGSCNVGIAFANCLIDGGEFMLSGLHALAGHNGPHTLEYTLSAQAHGRLSKNYIDCSSGGDEAAREPIPDGVFIQLPLAEVIDDNGGSRSGACGSEARSGDPFPPNAVPAPASALMAAIGLLAVGVRRRRLALV